MTTSERVYRWLLAAYPPAFRKEYGREMTMVFRDRRREVAAVGGSAVGFWAEMVADVVRSALPLRVEALDRGAGDTTLREAEMLVIAIFAIMVGALEAAGAFVEFWSAVQHPMGSGPWVLGSTMGLVAGGLLLGSGVALLRRSPGAVQLARGAAVTCIVVFLLISYVIPMMGYFAQLLGIGFPIVLLLYLRRGRGDWGGLDGDPELA
jgi:hypothetical protein